MQSVFCITILIPGTSLCPLNLVKPLVKLSETNRLEHKTQRSFYYAQYPHYLPKKNGGQEFVKLIQFTIVPEIKVSLDLTN